MRKAAIIAAIAASLTLSACISFGAKPPPVLYTLTAEAPVAAPGAAQGKPVIVAAPVVPQKLATARIPVQSSDTEIAYLVDAQWVETPGKLFQRLLGETISSRTGRVVLPPGQFNADPAPRLTGELLDFGLDDRTMEVIVTYDAFITVGTTVTKRRFTAREAVTAAEPGLVAEALNRASNRVAAEVADWIKVIPDPAPPPPSPGKSE